jgi:hypothetical protein
MAKNPIDPIKQQETDAGLGRVAAALILGAILVAIPNFALLPITGVVVMPVLEGLWPTTHIPYRTIGAASSEDEEKSFPPRNLKEGQGWNLGVILLVRQVPATDSDDRPERYVTNLSPSAPYDLTEYEILVGTGLGEFYQSSGVLADSLQTYQRPDDVLLPLKKTPRHLYDVWLLLAGGYLLLLCVIAVLGGAVPRWIGMMAAGVVLFLYGSMFFAKEVLLPTHYLFQFVQLGVPSVLVTGLAWRALQYHPDRRTDLFPRRGNGPSDLEEAVRRRWEAFGERRTRDAAVVAAGLRRFNQLSVPVVDELVHPGAWRLVFRPFFEPTLLQVAFEHYVQGRSVTTEDVERHYRLFYGLVAPTVAAELAQAEAPGSTSSSVLVAPDTSSTTGTDGQLVPVSQAEVVPLVEVEPVNGLTTELMAIIRDGDVLSLAHQIAEAQLRHYEEVQNRPLSWWRRILRLPKPTAPLHEQVGAILDQLTELLAKADATVIAAGSVARNFRTATNERVNAELDLDVETARKRAEKRKYEAEEAAHDVLHTEAIRKAQRLRRIEDDVDPDERRSEELKEAEHRKLVAEAERASAMAEAERKGLTQKPPRRPSETERVQKEVDALRDKVQASRVLVDAEQQLREQLVAQYGSESTIVKQFDREREARHIARLERT